MATEIPSRAEVLDALDALETACDDDMDEQVDLIRRYVDGHESRAAMRELLERTARVLDRAEARQGEGMLSKLLRGWTPQQIVVLLTILSGFLGLKATMPTLPFAAAPASTSPTVPAEVPHDP
jgi:hypothetical protein